MRIRLGLSVLPLRFFYRLIARLAQPLLRRKLRLRARAEPLYGEHIAERFGDYTSSTAPQPGVRYWWLHAVSLGEVRAARPLIEAMRTAYPQWRLLLTSGTATGRAEGSGYLQQGDVQVWQPWDSCRVCRRFLRHYQPVCGLIMETEVWPNLLAVSREQGLPLVLVNARLSMQSLRKAQRLAWLARPAYRTFDLVLAQTQPDAQRLQQLGVAQERLQVTGNMKFDVSVDSALTAQGRQYRQNALRPFGTPPLIAMFASSREGEEQMLVQALRSRSVPGVLWLIVPRHPQRFDAVEQLLRSAGYGVCRRSSWAQTLAGADAEALAGGCSTLPANTVLLGDSMGEMPMYYSMADVALLGGSFAPLGGQNLIEALACGCPVLAGEHTFNFADVTAAAVQTGAALRTADMQTATAAVQKLAQQPQALLTIRKQARSFGAEHAGASRRNMQAIQQLLSCTDSH